MDYQHLVSSSPHARPLVEDTPAEDMVTYWEHMWYRRAIQDTRHIGSRKPFLCGGLRGYEQLQAIDEHLAARQRRAGLEPYLSKLQACVQRAVEQTRPLAEDVREARKKVVKVERLLADEPATDGLQPVGAIQRQRMDELLAECEKQENAGPTVQTLQLTWRRMLDSWGPDLYHCYGIEGLPRSNLGLEALFGQARRQRRRLSGQADTSSLRVTGQGYLRATSAGQEALCFSKYPPGSTDWRAAAWMLLKRGYGGPDNCIEMLTRRWRDSKRRPKNSTGALLLLPQVDKYSPRDSPYHSTDGRYYTQVGIDPAGGADPGSGEIVWSDTRDTMDTWLEHRVEAMTENGFVTVWLRGRTQWGLSHNDAYWDDASLTITALPPTPTVIPSIVRMFFPPATLLPEPSTSPGRVEETTATVTPNLKTTTTTPLPSSTPTIPEPSLTPTAYLTEPPAAAQSGNRESVNAVEFLPTSGQTQQDEETSTPALRWQGTVALFVVIIPVAVLLVGCVSQIVSLRHQG